jgi:hypothetical protein
MRQLKIIGSRLFILVIPIISCFITLTIGLSNVGQVEAAGPAFVQVVAAQPQTNQTSVSVTFTKAQSAGDTNVIAIGWGDTTSNITKVTDSEGNVYAVAAPTVRGLTQSQAIYYAKNIVGAAANTNTVTVTFNTAAAYVDLRASEYSGLDPNAPLDQNAFNSGTSASATTPSETTSYSSELIFGAGDTSGAFTAAGSGFTKRLITNPDSDITEDKTVSSAGSYNVTAKQNGYWVMQMATFKAATIVMGTPTPTPTPTPTVLPTSTPTPTVMPTSTPTPTGSPTPTQVPSISPTPIIGPSFVQADDTGTFNGNDTSIGSGTYNQVLAHDTGIGHTVILVIQTLTDPGTQTDTVASVSSKMGTFQRVNSYNDGADNEIWICTNTTGAADTMTVTTSTNAWNAFAIEFNQPATGFVDGGGQVANLNYLANQSWTLSPGAAGNVAFVAVDTADAYETGPSSPWTFYNHGYWDFDNGTSAAWQVASSASPVTATWQQDGGLVSSQGVVVEY